MKRYIKASDKAKNKDLTDLFQLVIDLEDQLEYTWKYVMNNDRDSKLVKESTNLYSELIKFNDVVIDEIN